MFAIVLPIGWLRRLGIGQWRRGGDCCFLAGQSEVLIAAPYSPFRRLAAGMPVPTLTVSRQRDLPMGEGDPGGH